MYNTGAVYMFLTANSGAMWSESQKLTASDGEANNWFGIAVSLYSNTLVVGAHGDDDKTPEAGGWRPI